MPQMETQPGVLATIASQQNVNGGVLGVGDLAGMAVGDVVQWTGAAFELLKPNAANGYMRLNAQGEAEGPVILRRPDGPDDMDPPRLDEVFVGLDGFLRLGDGVSVASAISPAGTGLNRYTTYTCEFGTDLGEITVTPSDSFNHECTAKHEHVQLIITEGATFSGYIPVTLAIAAGADVGTILEISLVGTSDIQNVIAGVGLDPNYVVGPIYLKLLRTGTGVNDWTVLDRYPAIENWGEV
jgi:hypothetical protein